MRSWVAWSSSEPAVSGPDPSRNDVCCGRCAPGCVCLVTFAWTARDADPVHARPVTRRASEGMTESFAELFEQSLANQRIRPGMILTGLVVDVTPDVVIVNVGLKS